jgi:hypothetical protein
MLSRALYLISPAVCAGIAHAVVLRRDAFRALAVPVDRGRTLLGAPLFGANKTWRGPLVMVTVSAGAAVVVGLPAALGACLGGAYSLAELPNSFVKRRLGIAPGARSRGGAAIQYVADQGDSALGCTLALLPFTDDGRLLCLVFALGFVIHAAVDALLHALGVKRLQRAPA